MDTEIYFCLQLVTKMIITAIFILPVIRRFARQKIDYISLFICILLTLSFSLIAIITTFFKYVLIFLILYGINVLIEYVSYRFFKTDFIIGRYEKRVFLYLKRFFFVSSKSEINR